MYPDRNRARQIMEQGCHTCVLCCGEEIRTDDRRGVRPLLDLLEQNRDWRSFCAADKVVGKAAAFLYRLLGIRALYAQVVSEPAARVLADGGIDLSYGALVPAIRNRTDTGFCPMETAVWELDDPEEALTVLKITLEQLKNTGSGSDIFLYGGFSMHLGFKIHFPEKSIYVSAAQLKGEVCGDVTVYKTKVCHVDVVWTHTAHRGGVWIDMAVSSKKPLGITRIDSIVLDVGIPCCTDHITLMGRETTQNEIRFPHELGVGHEYCETAVGLYPTLDAKGVIMAGVAPFQNICQAVACKDNDGRFTFCVKTAYTKEMLDCHTLTTERVYFHPDATIDELFTTYRDLLPQSSFPMPKLTGWNSWDYYLDKVTAADIFENIAALKDLSFAKQLHYIVLDDGWQKGWGEWVENEKFACGLNTIAAKIREAGFLPGIWMAPVGVKEDTAVFQEHPEWLCRKPDGELLYSCHMYYLDPTHPDVRKFILKNYRYQYQAGFRLFKMDFISPLLEVKSFYDKEATPYGVITQLIADVKACTGPDIVILGCSVPLECGADIAPSMRIGLDIHNHFSHVSSISRTIAWSWMYNNKVTRIDPDFIVIRGEETSSEPLKDDRLDYYAPPRRKQTDIDRMGVIWRIGEQFDAIEAETWANMVAISGGNIFLSDRMSVLNERGIRILENALALAGDEVRPVYLKDDHRVPSLWLGDKALLLVNWEEIPRTVTVTGITRSLVSHKPFTQAGDALTVTLLPHESFAACYQQ